MGDQSTPLTSQLSPPPHRSNMPFLYYGLVVVATAAIVLAVYNLIIVRWCANQYRRSRETSHVLRHQRRNNMIMLSQPPSSLPHGVANLTSSFRYKKGVEDADKNHDSECSVCLSVFEEGEEMKKLPTCNHSFHATCIDMWLYSHFDCPLCRAPVEAPPHQHTHTDSSLSRDGLLPDDVVV